MSIKSRPLKTRIDGVEQHYNVGRAATSDADARFDRKASAQTAAVADPRRGVLEQESALFKTLGVSLDDFGDRHVIGSQDSAYITATDAVNRVRGGGIGSSGWLARVTGPNEKYGVEREFVNADKRGLSGSGASGTVTWDIDGDGIYEYRSWAASSRYPASGFVLVYGGQVADLGNRKKAVEKAVADGDPMPPQVYRDYLVTAREAGYDAQQARTAWAEGIPLEYVTA